MACSLSEVGKALAPPIYFTVFLVLEGRADLPLRLNPRRNAAATLPSIPAPDLRGNGRRASRQILGFRVEVSLVSVANPRICAEISLSTLTDPGFRREISLHALRNPRIRLKISHPTLTKPGFASKLVSSR